MKTLSYSKAISIHMDLISSARLIMALRSNCTAREAIEIATKNLSINVCKDAMVKFITIASFDYEDLFAAIKNEYLQKDDIEK